MSLIEAIHDYNVIRKMKPANIRKVYARFGPWNGDYDANEMALDIIRKEHGRKVVRKLMSAWRDNSRIKLNEWRRT